jgi:hypothetical protein
LSGYKGGQTIKNVDADVRKLIKEYETNKLASTTENDKIKEDIVYLVLRSATNIGTSVETRKAIGEFLASISDGLKGKVKAFISSNDLPQTLITMLNSLVPTAIDGKGKNIGMIKAKEFILESLDGTFKGRMKAEHDAEVFVRGLMTPINYSGIISGMQNKSEYKNAVKLMMIAVSGRSTASNGLIMEELAKLPTLLKERLREFYDNRLAKDLKAAKTLFVDITWDEKNIRSQFTQKDFIDMALADRDADEIMAEVKARVAFGALNNGASIAQTVNWIAKNADKAGEIELYGKFLFLMLLSQSDTNFAAIAAEESDKARNSLIAIVSRSISRNLIRRLLNFNFFHSPLSEKQKETFSVKIATPQINGNGTAQLKNYNISEFISFMIEGTIKEDIPSKH